MAKPQVDDEDIQRALDQHFNWYHPLYRLDFMEAKVRRILADPQMRINVNIRKREPVTYESPIIVGPTKTGLLVGPDGKPL